MSAEIAFGPLAKRALEQLDKLTKAAARSALLAELEALDRELDRISSIEYPGQASEERALAAGAALDVRRSAIVRELWQEAGS